MTLGKKSDYNWTTEVHVNIIVRRISESSVSNGDPQIMWLEIEFLWDIYTFIGVQLDKACVQAPQQLHWHMTPDPKTSKNASHDHEGLLAFYLHNKCSWSTTCKSVLLLSIRLVTSVGHYVTKQVNWKGGLKSCWKDAYCHQVLRRACSISY